jgi:UDP-glucose 4-epimerase
LLATRGCDVRSYDLANGQDVCNIDELRAALNKVRAVVHLGAPSSVVHFTADPVGCRRATVDGTAALLSLFHGRIIVPSTAGVYGDAGTPVREDASNLKPINRYAEAKLAVERLCAEANASGGDVKVLRIFTGYGPDEWRKGAAASPVMHIVEALLENRGPEIFGDGRQKRDFIYIDDIATAVLSALNTESGEMAFNIGTGYAASILDVFTEASRQLGTFAKPKFVSARFPLAPLLVADISKAAEILGFAARTSLAFGIERTISAYRSVRRSQPSRA